MTSEPSTRLDERAVSALERIAAALEVIAGNSTPPAHDEGWRAAPMLGTRSGAFYRTFHAVRPVAIGPRAGRLVTGCGASGRGGGVDVDQLVPLEKVPRITRDAKRCESSGCAAIFAAVPYTESS